VLKVPLNSNQSINQSIACVEVFVLFPLIISFVRFYVPAKTEELGDFSPVFSDIQPTTITETELEITHFPVTIIQRGWMF